ncbi:MAG: regulatory protein LuxR [Mycobacterium sp.]|nr:regulatory protein LuxR [Mycobacterium sp.]
MSSEGRERTLHGRTTECDTLRALVTSVPGGSAQVLVLRGEAGVGKTALLRFVTDVASSFRCIQVAGVESDMELAYAGLQQLCAPLMGRVDELPAPQRDALRVAFGQGSGPTPDRFLVGLAVLSLLATAAESRPLLCVIDDAQWLDQVSVQTLGFVARRLMAEPVALLFAVRDTGEDVLTGLPELRIKGLPDADARDLLESVMVGGIDPGVRDRLVAETRGNPLALLEVPRTVAAPELAGGFWNAGSQNSPGRIEESFVRRVQALPDPTRLLLLVAAAEPVGDSALFLRAAARLGIAVDALAPAEAAGVIEFGTRMRFYHPLMRSAAYRAADLSDRRIAHRALADATDPEVDPDRRAWHAANAAAGTDDAVAAELESSAARAQSRGGIAAAAAFLERATILTADPVLRGARALAAAQAKRDAAAPAAAHELLGVAEQAPLTDLNRARAARLRAQMEFVRSRSGAAGAPPVGDTAPALLAAARGLEHLDDFAARESYLETLAAVLFAGRLGPPGALGAAAATARSAVDRTPAAPRSVDVLLEGMVALIGSGMDAGMAPLRTALAAMLDLVRADETQVRRWLVPAFPTLQESAAHELWDDTVVHHLSAAVARQARSAGVLAGLPQALAYQAGDHLMAGEFTSAATLLDEAASIASATGSPGPVLYHTLLLAAWRGVPAEATARIDAGIADGRARGEGRLLGLTGYAGAILYNGLGRFEEAAACAQDACRYTDLGFYGWCLLELVEAAVRSGDKVAATDAVRRLEDGAGVSGTDWGLGVLAGARALLADDDRADALFTEAVERLTRTRIAVHLARARLNYGEWLRGSDRRSDARRELTAAHEMFTRMGAVAFADRARRELIAGGEKVRKQVIGTGDELTTQEAQIARLAAEGLTNPEIGAQLFLSTHTVEWHLRKVFVKLGISSRRQLRTVSWAS